MARETILDVIRRNTNNAPVRKSMYEESPWLDRRQEKEREALEEEAHKQYLKELQREKRNSVLRSFGISNDTREQTRLVNGTTAMENAPAIQTARERRRSLTTKPVETPNLPVYAKQKYNDADKAPEVTLPSLSRTRANALESAPVFNSLNNSMKRLAKTNREDAFTPNKDTQDAIDATQKQIDSQQEIYNNYVYGPGQHENYQEHKGEMEKSIWQKKQQKKELEFNGRYAIYAEAMNSPDVEIYKRIGENAPDPRDMKNYTSNSDELASGKFSVSDYGANRQISDKELEEYRIIYGKYGFDAASQFMGDLRNGRLNKAAAEFVSKDMEGDPASKVVYAGLSGLDSAEQGIKQAFSEDVLDPTVYQYASPMVRKSMGSVGQFMYDLNYNIGNMTPALAASFVPYAGQILSAAVTATQSYGQTYAEDIRNNYTPEQARSHALWIGSAEAGMDYLLGGISRFGAKGKKLIMSGLANASGELTQKGVQWMTRLGENLGKAVENNWVKLGMSGISNATSEYLTEIVEKGITNLTLGTNDPISLSDPDAINAGVMGLATGLLFEGPGTIVNSVENMRNTKQLDAAYNQVMFDISRYESGEISLSQLAASQDVRNYLQSPLGIEYLDKKFGNDAANVLKSVKDIDVAFAQWETNGMNTEENETTEPEQLPQDTSSQPVEPYRAAKSASEYDAYVRAAYAADRELGASNTEEHRQITRIVIENIDDAEAMSTALSGIKGIDAEKIPNAVNAAMNANSRNKVREQAPDSSVNAQTNESAPKKTISDSAVNNASASISDAYGFTNQEQRTAARDAVNTAAEEVAEMQGELTAEDAARISSELSDKISKISGVDTENLNAARARSEAARAVRNLLGEQSRAEINSAYDADPGMLPAKASTGRVKDAETRAVKDIIKTLKIRRNSEKNLVRDIVHGYIEYSLSMGHVSDGYITLAAQEISGLGNVDARYDTTGDDIRRYLKGQSIYLSDYTMKELSYIYDGTRNAKRAVRSVFKISEKGSNPDSILGEAQSLFPGYFSDVNHPGEAVAQMIDMYNESAPKYVSFAESLKEMGASTDDISEYVADILIDSLKPASEAIDAAPVNDGLTARERQLTNQRDKAQSALVHERNARGMERISAAQREGRLRVQSAEKIRTAREAAAQEKASRIASGENARAIRAIEREAGNVRVADIKEDHAAENSRRRLGASVASAVSALSTDYMRSTYGSLFDAVSKQMPGMDRATANDVRDAIRTAVNQISHGEPRATVMDKLAATLSENYGIAWEKPKGTQQKAAFMVHMPKHKSKLREKVETARSAFMRAVVNEGDAVDRISTKSGRADVSNAYYSARVSGAAVDTMVNNFSFDFDGRKNGKSLTDIFRPIYEKGDAYVSDFTQYLGNLHNMDRMPQGKPVFGDSVTVEDSRAQVARLLEKHPEFEALANEVYAYNDNLMDWRVKSGLVSQETADMMKEMYPHYIPTYPEEAVIKSGNTLHAAHGNDGSAIAPIYDAMALQTNETITQAKRNMSMQKTVDAATGSANDVARGYVGEIESGVPASRTADPEDIVNSLRSTDEKTESGEPVNGRKRRSTIIYYVDGVQRRASVSSDLKYAYSALDGSTRGWTIPVIEPVNKAFKNVVTNWNPVWAITKNMPRDIQSAMLYSKHPLKTAENYALAWKEIATGGEYYNAFVAAGGTGSSIYRADTDYTHKLGSLKDHKVLDGVKRVWEGTEIAIRLSEFIADVKASGGLKDATSDVISAAAHAAAEVTVDFSRGGSLAKWLNKTFVPYLNPAIQGLDRNIRAFSGGNGVRASVGLVMKSLGTVSLMAGTHLANYIMNKDDDEYAEAIDQYKRESADDQKYSFLSQSASASISSLRPSDIDNYYLFNLGNGKWLKIPASREASILSNAAWRLYETIAGSDASREGIWDEYVGNSISAIGPANPFTSNIVYPAISAANNRTWYGKPIDSQSDLNKDPSQAYDESTSEVAKWIGGLVGYSPKRIDYLISSYGGVIGDYLIPMTSLASRSDPNGAFVGAMEDSVILDASEKNKYTNLFYDRILKAQRAKNSVNAEPGAEYAYTFLSQQSKKIDKLQDQIKEIENNGLLSEAEKRQKIRELSGIITGMRIAAIADVDAVQQEAAKHDYVVWDEKQGKNVPDSDRIMRDTNRSLFGTAYAIREDDPSLTRYQEAMYLSQHTGMSLDDYYEFYYTYNGYGSDGRKPKSSEDKLKLAEDKLGKLRADNLYTQMYVNKYTTDDLTPSQGQDADECVQWGFKESDYFNVYNATRNVDGKYNQVQAIQALGFDTTHARQLQSIVCGGGEPKHVYTDTLEPPEPKAYNAYQDLPQDHPLYDLTVSERSGYPAAEKYGFKEEDYATYVLATREVTSDKNEKGNTVPYSKRNKQLQILVSKYGLTARQAKNILISAYGISDKWG